MQPFRLHLTPVQEVPGTSTPGVEPQVLHANRTTQSQQETAGGPLESRFVGEQVGRSEEDKAIKSTWSKGSFVTAYIAIFAIFYVCSLQQQINASLVIYALSFFEQHPYVAFVGVVTHIFSVVCNMPMAKVIGIGEYIEGFLWAVGMTVGGLFLTAVCKSLAGFVVAQMMCWLGYRGIFYILDVIIADTSSLEKRAFLLAFSRAPFIINTLIGPYLAQVIWKQTSWRWASGSFAIIIPVVCIPLFVVLVNSINKPTSIEGTPGDAGDLTLSQNVWTFLVQFDLPGLFLLGAGFTLLLLPLSVSASPPNDWSTSHKIIALVISVVLLTVFVLWETVHAPFRFAPFPLLLDPTVLGACFGSGTLFISFYCLETYFTSYLQVVYNLSIADAGYIHNAYVVIACSIAMLTGFMIRIIGKFKILALVAIVWHFVGTGLLIYIHQPRIPIAYVGVFQGVTALSGGALAICAQIAIMAAAVQSNVAGVLALLGLFTGLGAATGQAVASAIYTCFMPKALQKYLPADVQPWTRIIYNNISQQLSYPMTSPVRQAIIRSYGEVMRHICIASLCLLPFAFLSVVMWKDINVKTVNKAKEQAESSSAGLESGA